MSAAHSRGQVPLSLITDSFPEAVLRGWHPSEGNWPSIAAICMQAGRLCGPGQYHMAVITSSDSLGEIPILIFLLMKFKNMAKSY